MQTVDPLGAVTLCEYDERGRQIAVTNPLGQVRRTEWHDRFDLPFDLEATGYGQSTDEVAAVTTTSELLAGYAEAVTPATRAWLADVTDADLDRVVDDSWDPPVTLGARLVSVVEDDLLHLGQAQYLRGLR